MSSIHVIVNYCNHRLPARQNEYDYCIRRNLANSSVKSVHSLTDPGVVVPFEFLEHPKFVEHRLAKPYMTFAAAFKYASETLSGETVCVSNLDIFLDDEGTNWFDAIEICSSGIVLALGRYEFDGQNSASVDPILARQLAAFAQDAWVFSAPFDPEQCDIPIGTMGCDNALALRIRLSGRQPVNMMRRFRIIHLDLARGKTFQNFKMLYPTERPDFQDYRPEAGGYYLLPDFDRVGSIDKLMDAAKASPRERYEAYCDLLTKLWPRLSSQ